MVMMAGRTVTGTKRSVLVTRSDIWILPARPINEKRMRKVTAAMPSVRAIK